MIRITTAVLACSLCFAASASAQTSGAHTLGSLPQPYSSYIAETQAPVDHDALDIYTGRACPVSADAFACTETGDAAASIYLNLGRYEVSLSRRYVFYRELGHAFDYAYITPDEQQHFEQLWSISTDVPWWADQASHTHAAIYTDPAEEFADAYALCAMYGMRVTGADLSRWRGMYSDYPANDLFKQRETCQMIHDAAPLS